MIFRELKLEGLMNYKRIKFVRLLGNKLVK